MASRVVGSVDGTRKGSQFDVMIAAVTHIIRWQRSEALPSYGKPINVVAGTRSSPVQTISFAPLPMWSVCGFDAD